MIVAGDRERIAELIDSLSLDTRKLLRAAIEISYYSRGAWTYSSVLQEPPLVRDLMVEFINGRLEAAGKSPFPVY